MIQSRIVRMAQARCLLVGLQQVENRWYYAATNVLNRVSSLSLSSLVSIDVCKVSCSWNETRQ